MKIVFVTGPQGSGKAPVSQMIRRRFEGVGLTVESIEHNSDYFDRVRPNEADVLIVTSHLDFPFCGVRPDVTVDLSGSNVNAALHALFQ
ncbi:hypothetical protein [Caballeronia sp. dw_276]|uniref:hypothetical protein n=1 Tax=Caballeronia sp. dw_276 TaxID=2719795 RepID=UPI001BD3AE97|nr:hypothetical protein [Caballeronia sp. dw_276]